MSICAPKPFGSKFLKGGYSYWPLWWYGQKGKLHDMSGHGIDLTPSGAYFDGQGYYFDGSDDYLIDVGGRKVLEDGTSGSWHSIYLTEGEVLSEGSIRGTGTKLSLNVSGASPKITGKIILRPEYCPNLIDFRCYNNNLSVLDVSGMTSLEYLNCRTNSNLLVLNVSALVRLEYLFCYNDNISVLDVSGMTLLYWLFCYNNNISVIDVSRATLLTRCYCYNNNISVLDVSGATSLKELGCHNNSMNQSMVDTVLCDMDSHGTSDGYLDIHGNTAPSATGVACKDNLVARGWSVTTD